MRAEEDERGNATRRRRHRERVELVDVSGWDRYFNGNLTVDPTDVVSIFVIPVPKGDSRLPARYNITFIIPDPPEGCTPNTTLWLAMDVHRSLCSPDL